jgi:hypothetical protein
MYSLQQNNISKPTVNELVSFYKRQKLELRDDGTRLIRPIARPDYMINNDEVHTSDLLGKVRRLMQNSHASFASQSAPRSAHSGYVRSRNKPIAQLYREMMATVFTGSGPELS